MSAIDPFIDASAINFASFLLCGIAILVLFKATADLSFDRFFLALWENCDCDTITIDRLHVWSQRKVSSGESDFILSVHTFQMRLLATSAIGLIVANFYVHFLQGLWP